MKHRISGLWRAGGVTDRARVGSMGDGGRCLTGMWSAWVGSCGTRRAEVGVPSGWDTGLVSPISGDVFPHFLIRSAIQVRFGDIFVIRSDTGLKLVST